MNLRLEGLSKGFGPRRVLAGVSLTIPAGAVTAVLGMNGAGKTTLLRCLSGLSSGDCGGVFIDGEELRMGRLDLRRRLMFLPDFPPAFPGADVLENVAAHLRFWEADRPGVEDKVAAWLEAMGMLAEAGRSVQGLSRGQGYKAALLALLAVDPELWILDEPMASGMDPRGLAVFRREAAAAAARGASVVYSTQIPELAAAFADTVLLIAGGKVRMLDPERDFGRDPARLEAIILSGEA